MDVQSVVTIIIAALGLLLALWQFLKNQKLQKKNLEFQQQMLEQQREKDENDEKVT